MSTLEKPSGCQEQKSCSGKEEGEQRRRWGEGRAGSTACWPPPASTATTTPCARMRSPKWTPIVPISGSKVIVVLCKLANFEFLSKPVTSELLFVDLLAETLCRSRVIAHSASKSGAAYQYTASAPKYAPSASKSGAAYQYTASAPKYAPLHLPQKLGRNLNSEI